MSWFDDAVATARMAYFASRARLQPDRRRVARDVARAIELPTTLPSTRRRAGTVWAVTMVRNEADIVGATIAHLLDEGVDGILVADNNSDDGTADVLADVAARSNRVHVARDHLVAFHQDTKMTYLANGARRAGADWIVPFDADELWFADGDRLASWLRRQPRAIKVVRAEVHNAYPTAEPPATGLDPAVPLRMEIRAHVSPKVAFRSHRLASLTAGNHDVRRPGAVGRGLFVAHLPFRSSDQFERKMTQGREVLEATTDDPTVGYHWRHIGAMEGPEQRRVWDSILAGDCAHEFPWSPVGPFELASPLRWRTWDPHQVLAQPVGGD